MRGNKVQFEGSSTCKASLLSPVVLLPLLLCSSEHFTPFLVLYVHIFLHLCFLSVYLVPRCLRRNCRTMAQPFYLSVCAFQLFFQGSEPLTLRLPSTGRLITDRFALSNGTDHTVCDPGKRSFCGGTWNTSVCSICHSLSNLFILPH